MDNKIIKKDDAHVKIVEYNSIWLIFSNVQNHQIGEEFFWAIELKKNKIPVLLLLLSLSLFVFSSVGWMRVHSSRERKQKDV